MRLQHAADVPGTKNPIEFNVTCKAPGCRRTAHYGLEDTTEMTHCERHRIMVGPDPKPLYSYFRKGGPGAPVPDKTEVIFV